MAKTSAAKAAEVARPTRSAKPRPRVSAKKGKSGNKGKSAKKSKAAKTKSHDDPLPDFIPPTLAKLQAEPPTAASWLHEVKFDGYRIQARLDHGEVRLLTRKGLDWAHKFPNIAAAVADLPAETALLDGEMVVGDERGVSSFSASGAPGCIQGRARGQAGQGSSSGGTRHGSTSHHRDQDFETPGLAA